MAITETAAFYNTQMPGPSEFLIKQAWWTQVLEAPKQFPMLKCVNWFDELKRETVAQNDLIDWRISANPQIREAFVSDLRVDGLGDHFLTEDETMRLAPNYIASKELPEILLVSGRVNVSLEIKAETGCDLVIDLLDDNFQWQGGTWLRLSAGTGIVTTCRILHMLLEIADYEPSSLEDASDEPTINPTVPDDLREWINVPSLLDLVENAIQQVNAISDRTDHTASWQVLLRILVYAYSIGVYTSDEIAESVVDSFAPGFWDIHLCVNAEPAVVFRGFRRANRKAIEHGVALVLEAVSVSRHSLRSVCGFDCIAESQDRVLRAIEADCFTMDF